jgi:hypothetical protein
MENQTAMSATTELAPLPEEQAREAINRWSKGFFRVRYLGDKIFLNKIIPCYSYNVRLETQYEERTVATASEPYHGQPIDNHGTPPDRWSIPVREPSEFEKRIETLRVPHTDRVTRCPQCAGVGEIACPRCHGTGHTACFGCGGSGFVQRTEPRHGQDAQGQTTVRYEPVRLSCPSCSNGRVSCSSCSGNGRIACPQCEGHCRVCLYERLTVRFRNQCLYEVLDTTEVPDENFEKLTGESIFARHAPRVETAAGLPPTVQLSSQKLLSESQAVDERQAHLLFQDMVIERVPVHEVQYMYAGVDRRLWIYGDGHIHAPGAPWRRGRLVAIIAAAGAALIAIVAAVLLLRG